MNSGTRLMLFHEDGELQQILFPRLSPLWILALISTLTLFVTVLTLLSLRLYHEKQAVLEDLDEVQNRLFSAEMKLKQVQSIEEKSVAINTLEQQVSSIFLTQPHQDFEAPMSAIDVRWEGSPMMMMDGTYRFRFSIAVKSPSETLLAGSVCGLFFGQDGVLVLPSSKVEKGWLGGTVKPFGSGEHCDPFKIKSSKTFDVRMHSPFKKGMVFVYSDEGKLWQIKNIII